MGVRVWLFPKDSDRFVWGGTCHPYSHKKHSKFQQRTAYPRLLQANLEGQTHLYINLIDTLKPTEESSLVHPVPIVHPAPCETKLKSHEKKKKRLLQSYFSQFLWSRCFMHGIFTYQLPSKSNHSSIGNKRFRSLQLPCFRHLFSRSPNLNLLRKSWMKHPGSPTDQEGGGQRENPSNFLS